MRRIAVILLGCVTLAGCQRGDIEVSLVAAGQVAPHDGFNFGPESWVTEGQKVPMSGFLVDPRFLGLQPPGRAE